MGSNKVTATVLAGGGSTRMGRNKALLKLGDKMMIERVVDPLKNIFDDILVVTNEPEEYNMLKGVKFVKDCVDAGKKSSLIGLYSGLKQSKTSHIFAIGCDMPFVNTELIKYMADLLKNEDVIVPFSSNGSIEHIMDSLKNGNIDTRNKNVDIKSRNVGIKNRNADIKNRNMDIKNKNTDMVLPVRRYYQPLHAMYGKGCIPGFERLLKEGCYKIANIFEDVNVKKIMEEEIKRLDPYMLCFKNINTYEEYEQILHFFE